MKLRRAFLIAVEKIVRVPDEIYRRRHHLTIVQDSPYDGILTELNTAILRAS